ncbi:Bifunctional inhibitor/plant lipid transfer protein/seed storage helical domain [Sesbania bispinosa]|nr:Bifunctional inhibitor/plant lipid transfer protein/seed storage helical domain [Sesbania bispinosa]
MAIRCLDFSMLVFVATILVLHNLPSTSAQGECGGDIASVITECVGYIGRNAQKIPPSPKCCWALKGANITCFCKYITLNPWIEHTIDVKKGIDVAKTCGCKLPPAATKCGSYTIPPHN